MQNNKYGNYNIEKFPSSRIATIDIGAIGLKKHHVKALIELDVTKARKLLKEKRKANEKISFYSWIIKCVSIASEEFKQIHGVKKGKREVVTFNDVDISIAIEREVEGKKVPLPYLLRKANEKSLFEINEELKNAKNQEIHNESNYVLGKEEKKNKRLMQLYYLMPGFMRRYIWKKIINNPFLTKNNMGTVMITAVGMIGRFNGWVVPVSIHPLCFALGSVVKKPGVVKNNIEIRDYMYMSILVDHDIIDGAPAIRALSKLSKLIENAHGLE
jgi:pyruvate/2-oxoglutarate dehydrogenase complex dihydrolipoamide acyltransferase (E2) component